MGQGSFLLGLVHYLEVPAPSICKLFYVLESILKQAYNILSKGMNTFRCLLFEEIDLLDLIECIPTYSNNFVSSKSMYLDYELLCHSCACE